MNEGAPKWAWGLVIGIVTIIFVVGVWWAKPEKPPAGVRVEKLEAVFCHSFPEGKNKIIIPLGPDRWEGVILPLDARAYDLDPGKWHQVKSWDGKSGPVVKRGQAVYVPIQRNRNISEATFWVRGEGEATVSIERE